MQLFRVLLFLTAAAGVCGADVILTNYPPVNNHNNLNIADGLTAAVGFRMGANSYDLTAITMRFNSRGEEYPVVDFTAEIHSGENGGPEGGPLVVFSDPPSVIVPYGSYTLVPEGELRLQANTTYWLTLHAYAPSPGMGLAMVGSWPSQDYVGAATYVGTTHDLNGVPLGPVDFNPTMQIEGDLVETPEPGCLATVGAGLLLAARAKKALVLSKWCG